MFMSKAQWIRFIYMGPFRYLKLLWHSWVENPHWVTTTQTLSDLEQYGFKRYHIWHQMDKTSPETLMIAWNASGTDYQWSYDPPVLFQHQVMDSPHITSVRPNGGVTIHMTYMPQLSRTNKLLLAWCGKQTIYLIMAPATMLLTDDLEPPIKRIYGFEYDSKDGAWSTIHRGALPDRIHIDFALMCLMHLTN
jgi:hypothetical protein